MDTQIVFLAALTGYLCGSISFARLFTRWLAPQRDITALQVPIVGTEETSQVGIVGANAASMILGPRYGCMIALLDMLKVILPMLAFKHYHPDQNYHLWVAVTGLVGHNWPIYFRFQGGRGFSTILGSLVVVDWLGALVLPLAGLFLGMVILRNVMVAYIAWLWLLAPWIWLRTHDLAHLAYAIALNLIFIIATLPETKTFFKYRREGKLDAYLQGLQASSPRWRGMSKMAERLDIFRK